jgi:hypothetical protein|tara:strand:- start:172 stop:399 length:228 start_codon:yes stop_codon:yes gene_type:complete
MMDLGSVSTGYSDRPVTAVIKTKHAGLNLTGHCLLAGSTDPVHVTAAFTGEWSNKLQATGGKRQASSNKLDKKGL